MVLKTRDTQTTSAAFQTKTYLVFENTRTEHKFLMPEVIPEKHDIELRAKSAVFSSLADAILVSGPITGQPADGSDLKKVAQAVGDLVPVFANTGVNIDNVTNVMSVASGCIIGTHFKIDGNTWNNVDGERVKRFMDVVNRLRG